MSKTILILEDNDERIAAFQKAVGALGDSLDLKVWRDAPSMIAECEAFFPTTALISLDHDLNPQPGATDDPGTGVDDLLHSSNTDRVYSMHNELRFAGWTADRVGPLGTNWIETSWLRAAKRLLEESTNTWKANLPADHAVRVERLRLSLDGLGLGDALGEMLSHQAQSAPRRLAENDLPAGPWFHTDDTEMAISICAVLKSHGFVDQDALAKRFARRFERDPDRGYGKMTRIQMREIMFSALVELSTKSEWHECVSRIMRALAQDCSVGEFANRLGLKDGVTGYSLHVVPLALYAWLRHGGDFRNALTAALNCGGDTDTVGAILGALCGASHRAVGIPPDWLEGISEWPRSTAFMRNLAAALTERRKVNKPEREVSLFWPAIIPRNIFFLSVVLFHGFRRLWPPY